MELSPVACNNCGAPLQIPAAAQYVTCQHCSSQLEVKRNESVAWTEKLEQIETIDRRTEQLVNQMAQLRFETALSRIDRWWDREEQLYMVGDQHGNRHRPNALGSVVAGCGVAVAGFFFLAIGGEGLILGPVLILCGIAVGFVGNFQAIKYATAKRRYRRRRNEVRVEDYRLDLEENPEELNQNPFNFLPPPPAPGSGPIPFRDEADFPGLPHS
jgi:DNA-directed RNA polymerase subunit RPC12/RpoP